MLLIFSFIICSCNNEEILNPNEKAQEITYQKDLNFLYKEKFSNALVKALSNNKDVRSLIKNEALKKINHDYDVLYQLIKDEKLNDGTTLKENLLKYIDIKDLELIEEKIPTLTIFVPELPQNAFSAELWNIEKVDPNSSVTQSVVTTSEYATNFSYEPTIGEKVKIGMKYGISNKETQQTSYSKTVSNGNDELGEKIVDFGEDIIRNWDETNKVATLLEYKTGWYTLAVEAKEME